MNTNWGTDANSICKLRNSTACSFKSCFVSELSHHHFKSTCKWNYKKSGKTEGPKGRNLKTTTTRGRFILLFRKQLKLAHQSQFKVVVTCFEMHDCGLKDKRGRNRLSLWNNLSLINGSGLIRTLAGGDNQIFTFLKVNSGTEATRVLFITESCLFSWLKLKSNPWS